MIEYVSYLRYDENPDRSKINARKIAVEPIKYFEVHGERFYTCKHPHRKGYIAVECSTGYMASQPLRTSENGYGTTKPETYPSAGAAQKAAEANIERFISSGRSLSELIKGIRERIVLIPSAFTFLDLKLNKII